jgi:outer membrane lipase/esterase
MIRNVRITIGATLLGLSIASLAHAQTQFGRLIVFGDSLSDGGAYTNFFKSLNLPGGNQVTRFKFTTNPGNVWVENIASRFGMTLTPNALDGGSNYAEGGARVTLPNPSPLGLSQTAVSIQIDRFLASNRTFEENDIVTMLVGANDIFQGGPAAIAPAATALVAQLGRLQAAGAKNIILMNVPDIGLAPSFGSGSGPSSTMGTQFAVSFNESVKQGLQGFSGNVLYIDSFNLFREVVANPVRFGLTNVTTPACSTSSSGQCTPATTVANGAESYLFADGLHPTTAGHRILSDAVISTLLAPSQISLLPLSVQASRRAQELIYNERLFPQGNHTPPALSSETFHRWELFGGAAGYMPFKIGSSGQLNGIDTQNKDFSFGADYQFSGIIGGGVVLSHTHANTNFGNQSGSFKKKITSLDAYGRARMGRIYTFATGGYGWTGLDDIRRDVHINTAVYSESGDTRGGAATVKAGAGYDFSLSSWVAGPLVSLGYEHITVNGYAEEGTSSTRLAFGSQTLSQFTGSVGLQTRLADNNAAVLPYVRAMYDYDLSHDARTVSVQTSAAVAAYQGTAYLQDRSTFSLTGGTRVRLAKDVDVVGNAYSVFGQSDTTNYGVTVALNVRF